MMSTTKPRTPTAAGLLFACVLVSLLVAAGVMTQRWLADRSAARREYTITGGDARGLRHIFAQRLATTAAAHGIKLRVEPMPGSGAALQAVQDGKLDFALVQGGLPPDDHPAVRECTALHLEPLHLLVRAELAQAVQRDGLPALRNRVINLSTPGSGTHALASAVLRFGELTQEDFAVSVLGGEQLLGSSAPATWPDAIFLVSSLPSPVAQGLIRDKGYVLCPLPFAEAFALGGLGSDAAAHSNDARVARAHVYEATIPAFTYDLNPPIPPEALPTLGTRLLFVTNKRTPATTVEALLQVVFESGFAAEIARPAVDSSLLRLAPEFPMHPGALQYQRRGEPLVTAEAWSAVEQTINIIAIIATALVSLWLYLRRGAQRARDDSFVAYVRNVAAVEREAMLMEQAASMDLCRLLSLQQRLSALKVEALDRLAAGNLEGEELMSGFLAQVNDARSYLARLILHERDNLEHEAQRQGRPLRELWDEAVLGASEVQSKSGV